jgi:hypothetical protein
MLRTRLPCPSSLRLNLLPLTVIQLVLVCFLLHCFSPVGETGCDLRRDVRLTKTVNGDELEGGPVVELSPTDTRIDGSVVDDGRALADKLSVLKDNFPLLHPGETFEGRVVVSADRDVPWRRLREVLTAARSRDYPLIDFAVVKDPPLPKGL